MKNLVGQEGAYFVDRIHYPPRIGPIQREILEAIHLSLHGRIFLQQIPGLVERSKGRFLEEMEAAADRLVARGILRKEGVFYEYAEGMQP